MKRMLQKVGTPGARRPRRGATSPVLVASLLVTGWMGIELPRVEARERDTVEERLGVAVREVVTMQRAHALRTGEFYLGRQWLAGGQHGQLVLPLAPSHRAITYYSQGQRGLVVTVGDVQHQRVCTAVVSVRPGDRPTRLSCDDESVPN